MEFSKESWIKLALGSKCPRCGEGALFDGYLKVRDRCSVCDFDLSSADAADGPAVFVMFVVGFIVVGVGFAFQMMVNPPMWVLMTVLSVLTIGLSMWLLRPFKAALIILQFRNDAQEGRLSD